MLHVLPIDHRERSVADGIHALMSLAYAQEARLLNVAGFSPLAKAIEDYQGSRGCFYLGALLDQEIVGVLSIEQDDDPLQLSISALAVRPKMQRQGIGRLLVREALARGQGMAFSVSTASQNAPALALYEAFGFVEYRHGVLGPNELPVVKLRRAA